MRIKKIKVEEHYPAVYEIDPLNGKPSMRITVVYGKISAASKEDLKANGYYDEFIEYLGLQQNEIR